ncbi:MAG: substrate-binding domain-containing protein [Proteobacteria bacterium]|nr:substrate-binding domain-containing protein [Pseudomonadota bacterium]
MTTESALLRIVGSSAVFPFAATVAEHFHYKTNMPTPLIEAIGTGAGIKLFCSSRQGPDGVMTSRPFTEREKKKCEAQGITFEGFKLGQDALVLVQNKEDPPFPLTLTDLNKALSEKVFEEVVCVPNPYKTWKSINPMFPAYPIRVLGPAPTSGTYDVLVEKIGGPCGLFLRRDGFYIEAPANENLIIQKVLNASHTVGIVTFSFYDQNRERLNAFPMEGILPSFASIQDGTYPLSRPLYLYIKTLKMIPERAAYIREFVSADAMTYLAERGLIPLSLTEHEDMRRRAQQLGGAP